MPLPVDAAQSEHCGTCTRCDSCVQVCPDLAVQRKDGGFDGSALFAYKLNWQTVAFLGYGDERALTEKNTYDRQDRQLFLKGSYAFQR